MSSTTKTLGLLRMDPSVDGDKNFDVQTMLNDNWDKIDSMAASSAGFYHVFEPEDWTETEGSDSAELRIPKSLHGMTPISTSVIYNLRRRIGRNTRDYDSEDDIAAIRAAIIAMVQSALAANTATPGTYPTAEDGHVVLTWEQLQYYLLKGELVSGEEAEAKAAELGFNWQERDTLGLEATVSVDDLATAAYFPALGAPSTDFNVLCTMEVIQALRLRTGRRDVENISHYDMDGYFDGRIWGVIESAVLWDLATNDLVIRAGEAYPGDILVLR